ncbi:uncharacterized protein LOC105161156 [Sesamum indicum]|uniref:Uncharacterized protein LOC105161156 n=1 Tax=Sesamum indicum TaxID=4182 RepID=A0A6I9T4L9_SESIN|nr:uncharacterized protein LOC105161156 [Sesamum indicum]
MSRVPYQLLELAIISAQDLASVSRNLRTYATTWINPNRKLKTRVDNQGLNNPTWNDKFIFRVDDKFLNSATSSVMIEIYAQGWLRDTPVGSVSVLISNLIPPSVRQEGSSRRFVALQIRRPSGRPQGILNMGVSLLDNTMKSMPLYADLNASAVGVRDLMDEKLCKNNKRNKENDNQRKVHRQDGGKESSGEKKIQLLRTLSDQTDLTRKQGGGRKRRGSSVCNVPYYNQGFMLNIGGSSVVGGGSVVHAGGSYVNGSQCNSDLGPSPSVVAAAVACGLYPTQLGPPPKPGSSVLEDWTVEEASMEGLKSKIERWRMELPQNQRYQRLEASNKRREKKPGHRRRKTANGADDDEAGRFSCFGNAYGCEFTIVCGSKNGGRKSKSGGYTSSKTSTSEV